MWKLPRSMCGSFISDTVAASQGAEESRDSAAGYAQAADASRTAVQESESNVNAQVSGFDEHVSQQTEKATEDITKIRQQAVSAVESQTVRLRPVRQRSDCSLHRRKEERNLRHHGNSKKYGRRSW